MVMDLKVEVEALTEVISPSKKNVCQRLISSLYFLNDYARLFVNKFGRKLTPPTDIAVKK